MFSHGSDVATLEGSGQRRRRGLSRKILQRASDQRQENRLSLARGQSTPSKHLERDVEQRRHVWGSHEGGGVIQRLAVGFYCETAPSEIADDSLRDSNRSRVAFKCKV